VQIRALTFNIRLDLASDRPNHWGARRDLVADLLAEYAPDLIGFQEVLPNQLDDLQEMLPDFDWMGRGRDADHGGEGCYFFWNPERLSSLREETFWLAPDPEQSAPAWDATYPRICNHLVAQLEDGRQLQCFNVHLDHQGKQSRYEAIKQLRRRLDIVAKPALVMGDFNLAHAPQMIPELLGLRDLMSEHGADRGGTFHGFSGQARGTAIDFILASPQFHLDCCLVLRDHWEGRYPSDHFPLLAQVQI
jgi:endonuclease/exonuclease/phosphatase family metal-dependent hydrolase